MIIVTGAKGFIGSNLVERLNQEGLRQLILVDENQKEAKNKNLENLAYQEFIERDLFLDWFSAHANEVSFIFHLGARADTTEQNIDVFDRLNLNYSKEVFKICTKYKIPMVYASSAATYGNGEQGYSDTIDIKKLTSLNPYGKSKQDFDLWIEKQAEKPPFWAGLKFFNVYGKNEWHKGRMASVVLHAFKQIQATGKMKLFQSHKEGVLHGEQQRDFIAVTDITNICLFFFRNQNESGLYNAGTGEARSFNDLVKAVFHAMELEINLEYIPTPIDIRAAYQYFTEASTTKLRKVGYTKPFTSLEKGISDYVKNNLLI